MSLSNERYRHGVWGLMIDNIVVLCNWCKKSLESSSNIWNHKISTPSKHSVHSLHVRFRWNVRLLLTVIIIDILENYSLFYIDIVDAITAFLARAWIHTLECAKFDVFDFNQYVGLQVCVKTYLVFSYLVSQTPTERDFSLNYECYLLYYTQLH